MCVWCVRVCTIQLGTPLAKVVPTTSLCLLRPYDDDDYDNDHDDDGDDDEDYAIMM